MIRMHQPTVSVIMPTYSRPALLDRAIQSVHGQTYRPIELLVIDDGSPDGETRRTVLRWADRCGGDGLAVRYLRQDHRGASAGRNLGLARSTGPLVQFFDSDDVMLERMIEKKVDALRRLDVAFVVCDCAVFRGAEESWQYVLAFSQRSHSPTSHVTQIAMNTSAPMFRREALGPVGPWDDGLRRWQDYEFNFRVLAAGLKGHWLEEILFLVRDAEDSISRIPAWQVHESYLETCRKIEGTARRRGIRDGRMTDAVGRKLATVYRMLAEEGHWPLAARYYREAYRRMRPASRCFCSFHRLGVRVFGCDAMRKLRLLHRV